MEDGLREGRGALDKAGFLWYFKSWKGGVALLSVSTEERGVWEMRVRAWVFLLLFLVLPSLGRGADRAYYEKIMKRIDLSAIKKHIEFLSSLGSRVTGYPGEKAAADYVEGKFKEIGLQTISTYEFSVVQPMDKGGTIRVLPSGQSFRLYPMWPNLVRTPQTPSSGIRGQLIYAGKCRPYEFNGKPVKDTIVLADFNCGNDWLHAPLLGARAVIFIEPDVTVRGEAEAKFLTLPVDIPRYYISKADASKLLSLMKGGIGPEVEVKCKMVWESVKARNIVGYLVGRDPELKNEYIVLQAYYDSMSVVPSISPGATQAVGIAVLLELARLFKANPPRRSLIFAATSGHCETLSGALALYNSLIGPLNGVLDRRLLFISLDLSHSTDNMGIFYKGMFYEQREDELQRRFSALGKRITALASDIEKVLGISTPESPLLRMDEIKDPGGLAVKLRKPKDSLSKYIREQLSENTRRLVDLYKEPEIPSEELHKGLTDDLNRLIKGPCLYEKKRFADVIITEETRAKVEKNPTGEELLSLNRVLLEEAYPQEIAKRYAKQKFVDGVNPVKGKNWRTYIPGGIATDSELMTLGGVCGMSILTINDSRPLVDTPLDTADRVDWDNVFSQAKFLSCLLTDTANDQELEIPMKTGLNNYLSKLVGRVVEFDPAKSYVPSRPIPGTIAVVKFSANQNKTLMGVRCTWYAIPTMEWKNAGKKSEGKEARFEVGGLARQNSTYWWGESHRAEAYKLDDDSGEIIYAPDLGENGAKQYPIDVPMNVGTKSVPITLFRCKSMSIFDLVDQRYFQTLREINIYDASTDSTPHMFGFCLPYPSRWTSYVEPCAIIFAKPGTRIKATMGAGLIGLRLLLLNSTKEDPLGVGFNVDEYPRISNTPFQGGKDMWTVDESRMAILRKYGIKNDRLEYLHRKAKEALDNAQRMFEARQYDRFITFTRMAWAYESRAYPDVKGTANDVVKGVIFYLFLLLPFSYFAERLLFAIPDINKRVLTVFGIFLLIFLILAWVHPAFSITKTPLIVLLAFVILALTGVVLWMIISRFEYQLKLLRQKMMGIHKADVGRISASAVAITLGISNMRKRKGKTILTSVTLILLTFTVLSFTSIVPVVKRNRIKLGIPAKYQGIMIRDRTWSPLPDQIYKVMENEFRGFEVAPRAWYFSAMVGQQSFVEVISNKPGVKRSYSATAVIGLTSAEKNITSPQRALKAGRWFEPGELTSCIIPSGMARLLGITEEDVGKVSVTVFGLPLKVIGIVDGRKFMEVTDLDDEPLTPVDYMLMQERRREGASFNPEELEKYIHLNPDAVLIAPYQVVMNANGTLRSVAINLGDSKVARKTLEEIVARLELNLYAGIGSSTYLYSSIGMTSVSGVGNLWIPILIAALIVLSTMLGSVYERVREIGIFSSVGLAPVHIASLFLAEALVYAVLGSISGYVLGQFVARIVARTNLLPGLTLNYSSTATQWSVVVVGLVVILSTLYPARKASQMAVPAIERKWKLPEPDGDNLYIDLPFTLTGDESMAAMMFLKEYFDAHVEYSIGSFYTDGVEAETLPTPYGTAYSLKLMVWLAPFDLGVSEYVVMVVYPTQEKDVYGIRLEIRRESGDVASWKRTTRGFLNVLRKQFLIWRTFSPEMKARYEERGREIFVSREAPAW
jgi:hypothetical protein